VLWPWDDGDSLGAATRPLRDPRGQGCTVLFPSISSLFARLEAAIGRRHAGRREQRTFFRPVKRVFGRAAGIAGMQGALQGQPLPVVAHSHSPYAFTRRAS
jgi:hypothetical protein